MKKKIAIAMLLTALLSCENIDPEYPDEPVVDYLYTSYYVVEDQLGNRVLTGRLTYDFTDGDGNLGLPALSENIDTSLPDTVKYNFFLQMYDLEDNQFVKVPESEGGILKYRIPTLDKNPTSGTMELDISYPIINDHDTIFYTFFIMDRDYNRSNVDSTEVQFLRSIIFLDDDEEEEEE